MLGSSRIGRNSVLVVLDRLMPRNIVCAIVNLFLNIICRCRVSAPSRVPTDAVASGVHAPFTSWTENRLARDTRGLWSFSRPPDLSRGDRCRSPLVVGIWYRRFLRTYAVATRCRWTLWLSCAVSSPRYLYRLYH